MSSEPKGKHSFSKLFWMGVGGIIVFVLTNFFADPIKTIGNDLYSDYVESRDGPTAWLCAPLQEARFIARRGDTIISDGTMGYPNLTSIVFFSNKTQLKDVRMLVYPLGHHENDPLIYQSLVSISDISAGQEIDVSVEEGIITLTLPDMAPDEFIHVEAMYGQPVSLILEVRSDGYVGEFHGIAGCAGIPDSFSGPPAEVVDQYVLSDCGEDGDQPCGVSGPTFRFEITEEEKQIPTLEQWVVMRGEKSYIAPANTED